MNDSSVLSATLVRSGWLSRVFRVETGAGIFEVEYQGASFGEWVLVDGVRVGRGGIWHTSMVAPHVGFRLGSAPFLAEIDVRAWPWLTMRAFRLVVAGKVLYSEGKSCDLLEDHLLDRHTDVKLFEKRLGKLQAKKEEWDRRLLAADRCADPDQQERFRQERSAVEEEVRQLEAMLASARMILRVHQ